MTEPRRIFALRDWLQLLGAMAGVTGVVITALGWAFIQWTEWRDVPERLFAMEARLASFPGAQSPELLEFRGRGIIASPSVRAGGRIAVTYVLRRSIDCPTVIRVQFYDFGNNTLVGAGDVPAIRSPVSQNFSAFTVRVAIPADLPPGRYSYFPEIVPQNCGVYGAVTPPMSDIFEVTE